MQDSTQNIDNNENQNDSLTKYISALINNAKPVQEFVDINIISCPKSINDISERMKYNFENYKGNYIILAIFFSIVFVVFNPPSLPLIFLWAGFFTVFKEKTQVNLSSYVLKRETTLKILGGVSVLYVLFVYYIVFALLATISFFVLLVVCHMNLFYEKEESEEGAV